MKRTTALALAVVLGTAPVAVKASDDDSRPGLAVLRADNRAQSQWWDEIGAERAQSALIAQLAESRRYQVMTRRRLADTLAAKKLWISGELSPASAIRLGRELGVRYLVTSTLVEFGTGARGLGRGRGRKLLGLGGPKSFRTEFVLRLIDTEVGRMVWSDSRRTVTPLREVLSSSVDETTRAEDAVFEQALVPLLEELAAQLSPDPADPATRAGSRS